MHAEQAQAEDLAHVQQMSDVGAGEMAAGETVATLFDWDSDEAEEAVLEFLKGIEERGWVTLEK